MEDEIGSGPAKKYTACLGLGTCWKTTWPSNNLDKVMTNLQGVLSIHQGNKNHYGQRWKKKKSSFCLDLVRYCGFWSRWGFSVYSLGWFVRLNNTKKPARKSRFSFPLWWWLNCDLKINCFVRLCLRMNKRKQKDFYPYFWSPDNRLVHSLFRSALLFCIHQNYPQHEYSSSWIRWQRTCSCLANETKTNIANIYSSLQECRYGSIGVNVNIAVSDFQESVSWCWKKTYTWLW